MEDIIGILFLLVPLAAAFLEKKLKKAADAGPLQESEEVIFEIPETDQPVSEQQVIQSQAPEPLKPESLKPEPLKPQPLKPQPLKPQLLNTQPLKTSVRKAKKSPILQEEVDNKPKEKIDKKKLVIYSEIMEPKYKN